MTTGRTMAVADGRAESGRATRGATPLAGSVPREVRAASAAEARDAWEGSKDRLEGICNAAWASVALAIGGVVGEGVHCPS